MESKRPLSLERRSVVGAYWSAISTYGNVIFSFIVFMVLARLLSPDEFGIVAIASVFIDIVYIVSRGGLPEAVIQRPNLDELFAETAFWLSAAGAFAAAALFAAFSPGLAYLFSLPDLSHVLMALSLVLLFGGLGAIHEARLRREFAFRKLAIRALIANLISGAVAIVLAIEGWGVWAMVVQRLLASFSTMVLNWWALGWLPRLRFDRAYAKFQIAFGVRVFSATLLNGVNVRLQEIIAAAFLSPAAVGYIRLSWRCIDLVSQVAVIPFTSVAISTYSQVNKDGGKPGDSFIAFVRASGMLAFPCFFGMAAIAHVLIPTVFGPDWAPAVPVLQILCLTAIPFVTQSLGWGLLIVMGTPQRNLQVSAFQTIIGAVLSYCSAPFGLYPVTLSHLATSYVVWPLTLFINRREAHVKISDTFKALLPIVMASAFMGAVVFTASNWTQYLEMPLVEIPILALLGMCIYSITLYFAFPDDAKSIISQAKRLTTRKRTAL